MNTKTQIILVAVAVLAAIVAGLAVRRATSVAPPPASDALLPGFAARAEDAAAIEIRTAVATLRLARGADGSWTLPDKTGIPARADEVRALLLGLAELGPGEPRTADPASYGRIGVGAPDEPDSRGTLVTVTDAAGATLASVILGDHAQGGTGDRFVRLPGEARAALAEVSFDPSTDAMQWTDRMLLSVPGDRVQSVVIAHPDGEEFALSRAAPEETDFVVAPLPPGRSLRSPGIANPISRALTNLTFEDIRAGTNPIDPTAAVSVVYQTFDGLVVALLIGDEAGERWTTVTFSASDPSAPPEDYEALRARVAGRQFRLPTWAATNMGKRLSDLLAPPGAPTDAFPPQPLGPVLDPDG